MTKETAQAIAGRIPGATAWKPYGRLGEWAVDVDIDAWSFIRLYDRTLELNVSQRSIAINTDKARRITTFVDQFSSTIAAAVADGFPDPREERS